MECIAVDWSGALSGAAARIWIARASAGALTSVIAPGSRQAVRDFLLARRRDDAPALVGLDFAFGLPLWYVEANGWPSIDAVWRAARDDGESWLRDCPPPFWGKPGVRRPHDAADGLRNTDMLSSPIAPKSVFQIGGAGSVGTGSVRGMPMLHELRQAGWAIWPFDAQSSHTIAEIYPRVFTGPVVKKQQAARAAWLARHGDEGISARDMQTMIGSEDAFDAGASALVLMRHFAAAPLPVVTDPVRLREGQILLPPPAIAQCNA